MRALWAALAAAGFLILSTPRLTAQGAYYDELHQVPAAFAYIGETPSIFTAGSIASVPMLNMPYSGALKSGIFGLYLSSTGADWTLRAWRLTGIWFVTIGLALFVWLSHARLHSLGSAVFLVLFLSDGMALLATRHDWGPVALALALRLLLLGVWIGGESRAKLRPWSSFALGLIVGLSLFEKLTNAVLIPALFLMMIASERRRHRSHWMAACLGGLLGFAPLVAVNAVGYLERGFVLSAYVPDWPQRPLPWGEHLAQVLAVGFAHQAGDFILALPLPFSGLASTALLPGIVLSVVALIDLRLWRASRAFSMSLVLLISYALIAIGLRFLPSATWVHHWLSGTPFQYAAIALTWAGLREYRASAAKEPRLARGAIAVTTVALIAAQVANSAVIQGALWQGRTSDFFHASLSEIGEFAARKSGEAFFAVSDWGVGTQIVAYTNGRAGVTREIFWKYEGPGDLAAIAKQIPDRDIYLVGKLPPTNDAVARETPERIQRDASALPCWEELPVDPSVASLAAVSVRRFRARPGACP